MFVNMVGCGYLIDFEVKVLDENDLIFVSDLRNLGVQKNVALTLVYMINVKVATSRELEIGTSLRQSEISLALSFMIDNGWIKSKMVKTNNAGRPLKAYSLSASMETIYAFYEMKAHQNYEESRVRINRLKELIRKTDK